VQIGTLYFGRVHIGPQKYTNMSMIPIRVLAYPVLITGICKTLLMPIWVNTTIKWIE
jgi:hypothetical protein